MNLVRRVPTALAATLTLTGPTTAAGSWAALDGDGEEGSVLETHSLVGLNVRSEATLNGRHGVLHVTIVGRVAPGRGAHLSLAGRWELQGDHVYARASASGRAAGAVDLELGTFELMLEPFAAAGESLPIPIGAGLADATAGDEAVLL